MKKRILIIATITCLTLGVFSLIFSPFISIESPLYSETIDKITTELIGTTAAAAEYCEKDKCSGLYCQDTTEDWGCDIGNNPRTCTTYACEL